jgi:hypothetical protein
VSNSLCPQRIGESFGASYHPRTDVIKQYDADVEWLRSSFISFGEIKEFFDLVGKRGMIFITYVSAIVGVANIGLTVAA